MYPIIHPIEPFDAFIGSEIKFTWRGNQIFKVRCIVKNNETGATVYDNTESTMKQSYTIPPNSGLVNGVYYVVYITVFDVNNNESDLQDIGTPFYCFSKPIFNLSVSDGELIQTSAYKIGINYSQAQDEALDSYSITLYTYQKTVLSSSNDIYNTSDMSYVVSGLENAKQYYLRATGKTLHGITLDTGFILITVSYTIAQVFNTLELNNKAESGAIEIKSNIVSAIGVSEKDVIYIGDEYADLHDNSVTFDEGFEVRGDFTKIFVFYEPERNKSIISFGDKDKLKVDIFYRKGKYSDSNGDKAYFELVANSCGINYVMNSGYVNIPNSNYQQFALLVNRQGGYYDLEVVLISTVFRYSANADGLNMTETKQTNSKYIGVGYMPREVLEYPNLVKYSNYPGNLVPPFSKNNANIDTVTLDGYKCLRVITNATSGTVSGVYYYNSNQYESFNEGDDILVSFMIKGSINGWYRMAYEQSTGFEVINKKNNYQDWERVIWRGKKQAPNPTAGAFVWYSDISEPSNTFYIKDLCIQKATEFTRYKIAPQDWLADPINYVWKPL